MPFLKTLTNEDARQKLDLFIAGMQAMPIGALIYEITDDANKTVFVNQAFSQITGFDLASLEQLNLDRLFGIHTNKEDIEAIKNSIAELNSTTVKLLLYRKDVSPFWAEWRNNTVPLPESKTKYGMILIRDIDELHHANQSTMLAKEEAERAGNVKSNFLAMMSHELRTPINGILGLLDLLSDTRLNEDQRKLLSTCLKSGRDLQEIINDVLDYSKIEAGKMEIHSEAFSLRDEVSEIIKIMTPIAAAKQLPLICVINEDVPKFFVSDSSRIRQIILNLLTNAIKFTEHGSVTLKITCPMQQGDGLQDSALIRFEVIDTGIGISQDNQEKLFKQFSQVEHSYSRRFGGTGLGLAITKQLANLLGGEVGVESRLGLGSKFWCMLPLKEAALTGSYGVVVGKTNNAMVTADAPSTQKPILVVEDNLTNQMVLTRYLDKAGYQHMSANNGQEALDNVTQHEFSVVLMDISMPVMDGITATEKIRALGGQWQTLPIIALTAHALRGDRERCIAAGMSDYLTKPIDFDLLQTTLNNFLGNTAAQQKKAETISNPETIEPTLIDRSALDRLSRDLDVSTMLRIVDVFLDDMERRAATLKQHFNQGSWSDVAEEAHALKSSSASCGLIKFSEMMRYIEQKGRAGDLSNESNLIDNFDECYSLSRNALIEAKGTYQS